MGEEGDRLPDVATNFHGGRIFISKISQIYVAQDLQKNLILADSARLWSSAITLKRDYTTTIDKNSQTGSDAKRCAYYDDFNKLYGLKASTKPTATAASLGSTVVEEPRDKTKASKMIVKKTPTSTTTVGLLQE